MHTDKVIRFSSRIYYKGAATKERYVDRAALSANHWFAGSDGVEWAVRLLSGVEDYATGTRFKAWRPSVPGTSGSSLRLHYIDARPHQLDTEQLRQHVIAPDPDYREEVWITRAWLESGFTAAQRRRIYTALKQLACARHWHDADDTKHDPYGAGERLHVLESGSLPGW